MEFSGPPEETKAYAKATVLPTFYQTMNVHKFEYDVYIEGIEEWRAKVTDYKPKVLVACSYTMVDLKLTINI